MDERPPTAVAEASRNPEAGVAPSPFGLSLPGLARTPSTLVASLVVGVAYAAAGAAGVWLLHRVLAPELAVVAATLSIPWLAAGIAVAGLMLFGVRAWPGVFAGCCFTWGLVQGDPWMTVLLGAIAESLSVALIVWMLRAWGYRPTLERYQDALLLVAAAALGRLLTSLLDIVGLALMLGIQARPNSTLVVEAVGGTPGAGLAFTPALMLFALRWWANTTFGVVLVVPLLAFLARATSRQPAGTAGEFATWTCAALGWLLVSSTVPVPGLRFEVLLVALLLVVWAALRFGVAAASLGTLVFSAAATVGFGLQLGTFAGFGGREGIEEQWGFVGLLSSAGLFLTALLAARERGQRQLVASVERYRRLFLANPDPLWAEALATGRIVVANEAALRAYGYAEARFLQLQRSDLGAELPAEADAADTVATAAGRGPVAATHRTASGRPLEVECSTTLAELDGVPVRVWFVDVVSERNDLRLAALNSTDLERQRLGHELGAALTPVLSRLHAAVGDILRAVRAGTAIDFARLGAMDQDAATATRLCRQLSRGASPIQFDAGSLTHALRQIPEALATDGGPTVEVSLKSFAPVTLSLERSEHVYRIVADAVRAALLRSGARHVYVTVEVTADALDVTVEDDAPAQSPDARAPSPGVSPLAVRAAAARAQFEARQRPGGGNRVHFTCSQSDQAPPPPPERAPAEGDALARPATAAGPWSTAPVAVSAAGSGWLGGVALFVAYATAGALGLQFLRMIDAQATTLLPPLALPWLANGVAVAGVMLGGRRLAPAVFLGSVLLWRGFEHHPWITVLSDACGETLGAVVVAELLARWGFRREFDRFRDLALLLLAAAIGRTVPTVFDAAGLHLAGWLAPGTLPPEYVRDLAPAPDSVLGLTRIELTAYWRWWINGLAGITLLVPVVLPVSRELWRTAAERWREVVIGTLALVLAAAAIAGGAPSGWRLPALALAIVLVAGSAVRLGVVAASAVTLVLSLAATVGYGLGLGPLALADRREGSEVLWGFVGLLAMTGLFLTTVVAEYAATRRNLLRLKERIEALFEASPRPLLVVDAATGMISLVNTAAERAYGYSHDEFTARSLAALSAGAPRAGVLLEAAEATRGGSALADVHRDRSGRRFDVEISATAVDVGVTTEYLCFVVDVTERNDLRRRVLEASDGERRRLAQELHDGLGQCLTGLSLGVASMRRTLELGGQPDADAAEFVAGILREAEHTCEQILFGLSPLDVTNGDLLAALRAMPAAIPPQSRSQLTVDVHADALVRLPLAMREHLYQIARESVTNALRHGHARQVAVRMDVTEAYVQLRVEDDGVGFDPRSAQAAGLGLRSMALRSAAVHGTLSLRRRREGGMAVVCRAPQTP